MNATGSAPKTTTAIRNAISFDMDRRYHRAQPL
ncbi:hypothetical protein ABIA96_006634 [Bradyrhizobium sp. LB11.1]